MNESFIRPMYLSNVTMRIRDQTPDTHAVAIGPAGSYQPNHRAQTRVQTPPRYTGIKTMESAAKMETGSFNREVEIAPLMASIERLSTFADLAANWDDEGAATPTNKALIETARLFVCSVREGASAYGVAFDAVPVADGGVLAEWRADKRRLQLFVDPKGALIGLDIELQGGEPVAWHELGSLGSKQANILIRRVING